MGSLDYDALLEYLRDEYGEHLRWVASFDSKQYTYRVRTIREDLKTELTEQQLETIVHRSMALFRRDRMDDVYFHLGDAEAMLVQHEHGMALHLYLGASKGVAILLERDAELRMSAGVDEALTALGV